MKKCPTGNYASLVTQFHANRLSNSPDTCLAVLNEDLMRFHHLAKGLNQFI